MIRSRRDFLRSIGIGAVAGTAVQWPLKSTAAAPAFEPSRAGDDGFIHLDSNENPYGPSPVVASAIQAATVKANRYAFQKYDEVTERIASSHGIKPERVLFGCGSTELLRVAACAYLGKDRRLIQAIPTYGAIEGYARAIGAEVKSVPLDSGFAHDLGAMLTHADASTGLVYICNPNNPTASLTPRTSIEEFIGRLPATTRVVIDEAYHHYVIPTGSYSSFLDHPINDERVIVVRTFSKVYGLAGLRLGYAVAAPQVIKEMSKFLTADGLNSIVAEAVGVALDDVQGVQEFVRRNRNDRQEFLNAANTRNLKPIDSHANFVMLNIQHPSQEVIEHFRQHKILIGRTFPLMDPFIRVSFGTPDQMITFWKAWDMLPWSNKLMHH